MHANASAAAAASFKSGFSVSPLGLGGRAGQVTENRFFRHFTAALRSSFGRISSALATKPEFMLVRYTAAYE